MKRIVLGTLLIALNVLSAGIIALFIKTICIFLKLIYSLPWSYLLGVTGISFIITIILYFIYSWKYVNNQNEESKGQ